MQPIEHTDDDDDTLGAGIDFADPNSPLAPYYLRNIHVAAVVVLAAVFVFITYGPVWHTDVWGHLRFGEYIVQHGKLPAHEMFSGDYADQEAEYVNYQWIAQAGAYLVYDLGTHLVGANASPDVQLGGGAMMLLTVHALLVTLRLGVLLFVFLRLTGSMRAALFGIVLVFLLSSNRGILRPQLLGELAFAILLLPLSRPMLSRRALLLIPLLFVVWANTHGSFPVGFVLLGAFVAGRGIEALRAGGWKIWRDQQLRRLSAALALSLTAVALLNPHGPMLFVHVWKLSRHPNLPYLEEWKPLPLQTVPGYTYLATKLGWNVQPTNPPPWPVPGYLFLATIAFLIPVLIWSPNRITATQWLLLLGFGWQTLAHARMLTWWNMIFAWVAVPHAFALFRRLNLFFTDDTDQLTFRKTLLAGLAAVALLLWARPAHWLVFGDVPAGSKLVSELTPLKAADYLKEQYHDHPGLSPVVFTSETMGEFLMWDLRHEKIRIFCYTHVHLLTPQHWQECLRVKNGDPDWEAILKRHNVEFVVVEEALHLRLARNIHEAKDRWQIEPMGPLLVAKRIR